MKLEQVKNYIKANSDCGDGISLGGIDANKPHYIGVYPARPQELQHICIGGATCTRTQELRAVILLHWGNDYTLAEDKANALYALFYGICNVMMDGVHVLFAEPGGAPVPVGRDAHGIFEFVINLTIIYEKEQI
ncbi:MAG: minor capsid protein [Ruthenibacterium sp.]